MNHQRPWIAWADCLAQIRPRLGLGQLPLQPIPKFELLAAFLLPADLALDRKSTRLNSSHSQISNAVFCLKKKRKDMRRYFFRSDSHRSYTSHSESRTRLTERWPSSHDNIQRMRTPDARWTPCSSTRLARR